MRYQLVLQFAPFDAGDFDKLVSLEERLASTLARDVEVDGHDLGSGEANIFLFSFNPKHTLDCSIPVIKEAGLLERLSAAYRPVASESYVRLWPTRGESLFRIR